MIVAGTTVLTLQRDCSTAQTMSIPAGLLRETPNRLFSAGEYLLLYTPNVTDGTLWQK